MDEAAPTKARSKPHDESLKSLSKVVSILQCFSLSKRELSVADICAMLDYPRSTTHRLLASMRDVGLLDQERERGDYRLGLKLFEFGNIVLANLDLHREALPLVDSLQRITNLAVHLAVFDGLRAVVVRRAESAAEPTNRANIIENAPSHCTGVGKAILAYQSDEIVQRVIDAGLEKFTDETISTETALQIDLEKTRIRGYSVDRGEHQPGICCVAAPIFNEHGKVFAAVSASGAAWQVPNDKLEELSKIVIHHAKQISKRLGYDPR